MQTIINVVRSDEECQAWYGGIIEDVKATLNCRTGWSRNFVYREGNQVAHSLAKLGLSLPN